MGQWKSVTFKRLWSLLRDNSKKGMPTARVEAGHFVCSVSKGTLEMQEVKTELLIEINQWSVCDLGGLRQMRQIGLLGYIAFKMLRGWSHKETSKIPFQWAVACCFSIDELQNHINSRVMLSHTWADSACPQKCPGKWRHSRLTQSLIWKPSGFAPESRTIICANC